MKIRPFPQIISKNQKPASQNAEIWFTASPLQLTWFKFRKHKIALVSAALLILMYFITFAANFFAPYSSLERDSSSPYAPPQKIRITKQVDSFRGLYVYGKQRNRDPKTLRYIYTEDESEKLQIQLFVSGSPYKLFGWIKTDLHLFGSKKGFVHLMGTDELGRDVFSRMIHGGSVSLYIGLIGVGLSFIIGILLGGISGYFGGTVDMLIQRLIEFITSIPTIPLWMGLTAALPQDWSPIKIYFAITIILAFRGWAGLARVVRGQLLDVRNEDFVLAAKLSGRKEISIITWHLIPAVFSYLIVSITLAIPGMILGETALSFLGLGLRPPIVSWGVLLQQAQNIRTVTLYPWLMTPALAVILVVLCFNFIGDGLRDAADPYAH